MVPLSIFILVIARFKQCNDVVSSFILIAPPFTISTDSLAGRYLLPWAVAVTSNLRAGYTLQPTATIRCNLLPRLTRFAYIIGTASAYLRVLFMLFLSVSAQQIVPQIAQRHGKWFCCYATMSLCHWAIYDAEADASLVNCQCYCISSRPACQCKSFMMP